MGDFRLGRRWWWWREEGGWSLSTCENEMLKKARYFDLWQVFSPPGMDGCCPSFHPRGVGTVALDGAGEEEGECVPTGPAGRGTRTGAGGGRGRPPFRSGEEGRRRPGGRTGVSVPGRPYWRCGGPPPQPSSSSSLHQGSWQ